MKFIALILSILISALAVMPCSDDITCEKVNTSEQALDSPISHNHSEDEGDLCTPFCTCACCGCGGFIITTPSFYLIGSIVMTPSPSTIYQSNFISSYYFSFWQPPKISLS